MKGKIFRGHPNLITCQGPFAEAAEHKQGLGTWVLPGRFVHPTPCRRWDASGKIQALPEVTGIPVLLPDSLHR